MMQKISDLKDGSTMVFSNLNHRSNSSHFMYVYSLLFFFCLQKRLYVLIFISGKNKNENMEMERVIEFPHARGSLSQKETAFGLGHCSSGPQGRSNEGRKDTFVWVDMGLERGRRKCWPARRACWSPSAW
ncbi:unnamed protein product [Camellia sinensis]